MSRVAKIIVWVVVILILVIVGKMMFAGTAVAPATEPVVQHQTVNTQAKDSSDAGLAKDVTGIEAQMNGLNSDSANADAALSAK